MKTTSENTTQKVTASPSIPFPERFHAFLLENITIRDPGSGTRMILKFADGTLRRADVNPELLRLGDLNGNWRATLYFRTNSSGKITNFVTLRQLRVIDPVVHEGSFWTASGKVIMLDHVTGNAVIRIFPERSKSEPFAVSARVTLEQINAVEGASFVHMSGRLEGDELIANVLQPVELVLPERWKDWVRPSKRKPRLENTNENLDLTGLGEIQ